MNSKAQFLAALRPHAVAAIGEQHSWLISWAIAKAAQECGWNLENTLIKLANNCLGIKAERGDGKPIDGVPFVLLQANTGPEAGAGVHWRKFESLAECFGEFVNQLNWRPAYQPARNVYQMTFEEIYTSHLEGHAESILRRTHEVSALMFAQGFISKDGRPLPAIARS